jgi:hypothetical protein
VFGAPAAWVVQFLLGYGVTVEACGPGGGTASIDPWSIAATAAAAAIAALGELAAIATFRATRDVDEELPGAGRRHFMATIGLVLGFLFFCMIVMNGVGAVALGDCRQG